MITINLPSPLIRIEAIRFDKIFANRTIKAHPQAPFVKSHIQLKKKAYQLNLPLYSPLLFWIASNSC